MGAYGNNTCDFCDEVYHDFEAGDHKCSRYAMKQKIDELREEIEIMRGRCPDTNPSNVCHSCDCWKQTMARCS